MPAKRSLVATLAAEAETQARSRSRARIQGPALDFVVEVLKHNDSRTGTAITIAQVRRALREQFKVIVSDGAIVKTVQNKLGRTTWAQP